LLVNRHLLTGSGEAVNRAAFTPDGELFAAAGNDRTVHLGAANEPEKWKIIGRHDDYIYGLDFSPDGRLLATGGKDDRVRLWDVRRAQSFGEPLAVGHDVYALAFSPDGKIWRSVAATVAYCSVRGPSSPSARDRTAAKFNFLTRFLARQPSVGDGRSRRGDHFAQRRKRPDPGSFPFRKRQNPFLGYFSGQPPAGRSRR
jgi:WD40 repeat protein